MPRTASTTTTSGRSATGARRTSARGRKSKDALTLLQEDHKRVQKMFKQFEKMNREDTDAMRELVASACAELDMHAALEEELFYPALREHLDDQKVHLVDEAEIEHDSAKQLMAQLSEIEPSDPRYAATFTVLGEYVNHHIAEEENELFKLAKKVKLDLEAMGEALQEQKQQRQGGEQAETEEPEEDEETSGQAPHEIPVKEMDIEDEEDMEPSDSKRAGRR